MKRIKAGTWVVRRSSGPMVADELADASTGEVLIHSGYNVPAMALHRLVERHNGALGVVTPQQAPPDAELSGGYHV